jgi:VIT1/CCC1 family predicted Fe2+/Mn2+ transporter
MAQSAMTSVSLLARVKQSFYDSVGDIVFGMEDGTVSIFGLVFGLAASVSSSSDVLLAGATGAVAAAVSMMAGTFLDLESANDEARAQAARQKAAVEQHPEAAIQNLVALMHSAGLSQQSIAAVQAEVQAAPSKVAALESAVTAQAAQATRQNPWAHALWMFSSDLLAASVPVIPFAFYPLETARIVSVIVTTVLLVLLGIGRARIGQRNVLQTVVETVGIAAAAAAAGLLIGKLITVH